ncbi:MAG: sulfur oxidation c-type cytochrome SoxX [Pseudomonadota bacterium]
MGLTRYKRWSIFCLACLALPAAAQGVPGDAAADPGVATMTLTPRVVVNSGRLEWEPFSRDLSPWPTLSHQDQRPTQKPRRVTLNGPLGGDPARGRELALRRDKGYCVVCHQLPGEQWPGTFGTSLIGYKLFRHSDQDVYQHIFDARVNNPNTAMPPYGSNLILNDQEIRDLVAYLQSLE